jgi:hypothetical protein
MFTKCWQSRQILRLLDPEDKGTKSFKTSVTIYHSIFLKTGIFDITAVRTSISQNQWRPTKIQQHIITVLVLYLKGFRRLCDWMCVRKLNKKVASLRPTLYKAAELLSVQPTSSFVLYWVTKFSTLPLASINRFQETKILQLHWGVLQSRATKTNESVRDHSHINFKNNSELWHFLVMPHYHSPQLII